MKNKMKSVNSNEKDEKKNMRNKNVFDGLMTRENPKRKSLQNLSFYSH